MKKTVLIIISLLMFSFPSFAAIKSANYASTGEVISVDPLYGRITIHHSAIKGFSEEADTEFFVTSTSLLKGINKGDLVSFTISDSRGDTRIEKISRTGTAPVKEDDEPLGRAVQGALEATGEVAKTVSSPIAPAHDVVSGTVGATTNATDSVLHDADPEIKKKF